MDCMDVLIMKFILLKVPDPSLKEPISPSDSCLISPGVGWNQPTSLPCALALDFELEQISPRGPLPGFKQCPAQIEL